MCQENVACSRWAETLNSHKSSPLPHWERWWCGGCVICFDTLFARYRIAIPIGIWLNFYDIKETKSHRSWRHLQFHWRFYEATIWFYCEKSLSYSRTIFSAIIHSVISQIGYHISLSAHPRERERELLCVVSLAISPFIAAPSLYLSYFFHSSAQLRKKWENQV